MKPEIRLRRALASSVATMIHAAGALYVEGTNYESKPLDGRFRDGLALLRRGVREGERVLRAIPDAARKGEKGGW